MEDKGLPDFNGKTVIVYLSNAPHGCEDGILMEYPCFEKRNGKIFLSGRIPEVDGQDWIACTQTAVSWDSVIHYIEFKSIEDYKKRYGTYRPTFTDKLRNLIK
jgi:hypothetical protein